MEAPKLDILKPVLQHIFAAFDQVEGQYPFELQSQEIGIVTSLGHGIARATGLLQVQSEELVKFPGDRMGLAFNLDPDEVGLILLDDGHSLKAGCEVQRTGRVLDVPVGEGLLGRVVDATGRPLDQRGLVTAQERRPVEREAPAIMDRAPVTVPLQTGIKAIDALIPIGRGQRELIVGDRQREKLRLPSIRFSTKKIRM